MNKIFNAISGAVVVLLILGAVFGLFYLDYSAYHARFPHAPMWTYFFQNR